jgi:hypothetical protein
MTKYTSKITCLGALPFWISDHVGIDIYNKLNSGESVELKVEPQSQVLEFLDTIVVEEEKEVESEEE